MASLDISLGGGSDPAEEDPEKLSLKIEEKEGGGASVDISFGTKEEKEGGGASVDISFGGKSGSNDNPEGGASVQISLGDPSEDPEKLSLKIDESRPEPAPSRGPLDPRVVNMVRLCWRSLVELMLLHRLQTNELARRAARLRSREHLQLIREAEDGSWKGAALALTRNPVVWVKAAQRLAARAALGRAQAKRCMGLRRSEPEALAMGEPLWWDLWAPIEADFDKAMLRPGTRERLAVEVEVRAALAGWLKETVPDPSWVLGAEVAGVYPLERKGRPETPTLLVLRLTPAPEASSLEVGWLVTSSFGASLGERGQIPPNAVVVAGPCPLERLAKPPQSPVPPDSSQGQVENLPPVPRRTVAAIQTDVDVLAETRKIERLTQASSLPPAEKAVPPELQPVLTVRGLSGSKLAVWIHQNRLFGSDRACEHHKLVSQGKMAGSALETSEFVALMEKRCRELRGEKTAESAADDEQEDLEEMRRKLESRAMPDRARQAIGGWLMEHSKALEQRLKQVDTEQDTGAASGGLNAWLRDVDDRTHTMLSKKPEYQAEASRLAKEEIDAVAAETGGGDSYDPDMSDLLVYATRRKARQAQPDQAFCPEHPGQPDAEFYNEPLKSERPFGQSSPTSGWQPGTLDLSGAKLPNDVQDPEQVQQLVSALTKRVDHVMATTEEQIARTGRSQGEVEALRQDNAELKAQVAKLASLKEKEQRVMDAMSKELVMAQHRMHEQDEKFAVAVEDLSSTQLELERDSRQNLSLRSQLVEQTVDQTVKAKAQPSKEQTEVPYNLRKAMQKVDIDAEAPEAYLAAAEAAESWKQNGNQE